MAFYEIIYETGAHSIASYADDDECLRAVTAQHERAVSGQPGGPTNHPAERVARVLCYAEHPATFAETQAVSKDELVAYFNGVIDKVAVGDLVSVPEVAAEVRDFTNPMLDSGPHESNYKAEESRELSATWNEAA